MPRVLHLCPDERSFSGVAAYGAAFRAGLRAAGASVVQHAVPPNARFTLREVRAYAAEAADLAASRADVMHAEISGGSVHELEAVRMALRRTHIAVVLTLHDPPHLIWTPFVGGWLRDYRSARGTAKAILRRRSASIEQNVLARTRHLFVLSHLGREALLQARPSVNSDNVTVLPYPVQADLARRKPQVLAPAQLLVGFVGHWYPGKGLKTLVEALARATDRRESIRLRLIGDAWRFGGSRSSHSYRTQILQSIDRSGLRHLIDLRGFVESDVLGEELAACDVVVLPYDRRRSVSGLVSVSAAAFDALGAGVPVLASDVRAMPEVITHGVDGLLFPAGDAEALAVLLRQLRDEPALRARLREGARRRANSLSPVRTAHGALEAYRQVLR